MVGLSLVVLRCADLAVTKRFYEALGSSLHTEKHGTGPTHCSIRIGGTVLELYPIGVHASRGVRLGFSLSNPEQAASAARLRRRW